MLGVRQGKEWTKSPVQQTETLTGPVENTHIQIYANNSLTCWLTVVSQTELSNVDSPVMFSYGKLVERESCSGFLWTLSTDRECSHEKEERDSCFTIGSHYLPWIMAATFMQWVHLLNMGRQIIWTLCFDVSESYSLFRLGHTLAFCFSSLCAEILDPHLVTASFGPLG